MSDSEEEYGPICATWGSQTPTTTESNQPTDAWKTLLDPNIKVGPNDLGSGNLHRQGRNFKPIDEEYILAQRNKVQIPKKKMKQIIKQSSVNDNSTPPPQKKKSNSTPTSQKSPKSKHAHIPEFTTLRPPQQNSVWSSTNLVETPFWEPKPTKTTIQTSNDTKNKAPPSEEWTTLDNGWGTSAQPQSSWEEYDKKQNEKKVEEQQQANWGRSTMSNDANDSWGAKKKETTNDGWGQESPKNETTNEGWNTVDKKKDADNNDPWANVDTKSKTDSKKKEDTDPAPKKKIVTWKDDVESGWNKSPTKEKGWSGGNSDTDADANGWSNWSSDEILDKPVSEKPSWLSKSTPPPSPSSQQSPPPSQQSSRFSIASKQRYAPNIDVPEPVNYKRNGKPVIPTATAPPPPPANRHLITINVEISSNSKTTVAIRELDDPLKLAQDFAKTHNISSDKVVEALTKLFSSQKECALKLKNKKLQRRVPKPVHNNNFPDYSLYESSPAYRRPSFTSPPTTFTSPPSTFSRKAYY